MASSADNRWVEVSPSQFPHEAEGLQLVRDLLPRTSPFRAWSNFEFRDKHGRWHEVDLLVLGRRQLHLIELKYYSGRLRGDDHLWLRDGHRAEDSPLKLARRKAQYFATKLQDEFRSWVRERGVHNAPPVREVIPFVQESVFLHHPKIISELSRASAVGLYGIDGNGSHSHLPGISELLLEPADPRWTIHESTLAALMARIGLVQRREREVGSWVIQDEALGEGDGWQEWAASHRYSRQERARIRFHVVPPGAPNTERRRVESLVHHEFRIMRRLRHDALLRPEDVVDDDLGIGLVYPLEHDWHRLDLWLADQPAGIPLDLQLSIIRQVGEALQYAHANRVVHRGITPHAVWVRADRSGVKVQVRDWQSAGSIAADREASGVTGVTALFDAAKSGHVGQDAWLDSFSAPEGALGRNVDRIRVDVFGLGALAFYLLAGKPAAASAAGLRTRLQEQSGLDLAPETPEISSPLRAAVLGATRPAVSERTSDVAGFLSQLAEAENVGAEAEPEADPLEASPGAVLAGRFRLVRRLGTGSTAVGLLVRDGLDDGAPTCVLKVAVDDAAADRLRGEAEVLRSLVHPRFVKVIEGPIEVVGRQALVLESAGDETLAQAMSGRSRLSLDLLERWGDDLLTALVELDAKGIDHRDIKPANLGIREDRSNRSKHLVLFDFSLSRAAASAVRAGTPPYLDPFLGLDGRDRYDSAAERYAAAVVLFEMAAGQTPVYGDGLSDPAAISDEATIRAEFFDPAVAQPMITFFQRALARARDERFGTAGDMLAAWKQIFAQTETGAPDNAEQLQEEAQPDTELLNAGLSARALSALEPYGVKTVGDLVAVDPARLSRLSGVADSTRKQIRSAASRWRSKYGALIRTRQRHSFFRETVLPEPMEIADKLLTVARTGRGNTRASYAAYLLGLSGTVDAFATQAQIAARLPDPVTAGRANQLTSDLQELWASDDETRRILIGLADQLTKRLDELGGVATVDELVDHLLTIMIANPESEDNQQSRLVAGLVRIVVDRQRAVVRGGDEEAVELAVRRREGRPVLVAENAAVLDAVEDLGRVADRLVREVNPGDERGNIVDPARVAEQLASVLPAEDVSARLRDGARLARLAAALSGQAAVSGSNELYHRELPADRALALALGAVATGHQLRPAEIRDRVRARFPGLAPLPERPRLDRLVEDSGLSLRYDEGLRVYVTPSAHHDTTGLETRAKTSVATEFSAASAHGVVGQRLVDSLTRRSFLALATPAMRLTRLMAVLEAEYHATFVNVTDVLISGMRDQANQVGLPWPTVLEADGQSATSRAGQGLAALVAKALPRLEESVEKALTADGSGPVVLTDASILARYGAVSRLSRWTDLATSRQRALWLIIPQLFANRGAVLDGRPVPLAAPGQLVIVDQQWVDSRLNALSSEPKEGVGS